MPDGLRSLKAIEGGVGIPSTDGWDLLGSVTDIYGTTYDIYMPPLMSFDESGIRSVFQSIKVINRTTGQDLTVEGIDIFEQLADWGIDYESVARASSYAVFEKALRNKGIPEGYLDLPDVRDYLLNQADLARKGVTFDVDSVMGLVNQIATNPDFATTMRRAGLMGAEAAKGITIPPTVEERPTITALPTRFMEEEVTTPGEQRMAWTKEQITRINKRLEKPELLFENEKQELERFKKNMEYNLGIELQSQAKERIAARERVEAETTPEGIGLGGERITPKTPEQLAKEEINKRFKELSQRRAEELSQRRTRVLRL